MSIEIEVRNERVRELLARFGAFVCGDELVSTADFCGHVTASARVWNAERTQVLQVWSGKNQRWKLPGAHGENDLDLEKVAWREASRALGRESDDSLQGGSVVDVTEEEVAEYWNTPAHVHLAVIFEYVVKHEGELPRGARWFELEELGL